MELFKSGADLIVKQLFKFRIILDNILPQIWRVIEVESDITFYQFHRIIQKVMGWTNSHLHEFRNGDFTIGDTGEGACEFGDPPQWEERDMKIGDYFSKEKTKISYTYDFGDNWEHTIILEGIERIQEGVKYPNCIYGARACPPEDCGSIPGYKRLLEVLADPQHEEYVEVKKWACDYDPEYFDKEEATKAMRNPVDLTEMLGPGQRPLLRWNR